MRTTRLLRHFLDGSMGFFLLLTSSVLADPPELLALNDKDRILFLGNGFVENDQMHAYFETRLQRHGQHGAFTVRSMGWSGDSVRGNARTAGYQVPEGFARLEKEVHAYKPTVIFLAYGMNESFEGMESVPAFLRDYDKLLKTLAPLQARIILLSPTYHEDLGRPFPDPAEHNLVLQRYVKELHHVASERALRFVDLFHPMEMGKKLQPEVKWTTNGILLNAMGYSFLARSAEEQLGHAPYQWQVHLDTNGKILQSQGTLLREVQVQADHIRFQAHDAMLPVAPEYYQLRVDGLKPGHHVLVIDGQQILQASADAFQKGVKILHGPMFTETEKLRSALVQRNQFFYRRWRPYNDHSRHWGYIGRDFKLYDQEIAEREQRIMELRRTQPHLYQITLQKL